MKGTIGRERELPPFVLGLATVASLMLGAVSAPCAAPAPDAVALDRLRAEAAAMNRFRVMTERGEFLVSSSFEVDPSGVRVRQGEEHAALVTVGASGIEDRRVEWARVERIEAMRSHGLRDGFVGTLVGAVIGFGLASWVDHNYTVRNNEELVIFAIPTAFCAGLGALHGVTMGWRRIYP